MRQLLDLLDNGTHGTRPEPTRVPRKVPNNSTQVQQLEGAGTLGTFAIERPVSVPDLEALRDINDQRMVICVEAGGISDIVARRTAEAEIETEFVRRFLLTGIAA